MIYLIDWSIWLICLFVCWQEEKKLKKTKKKKNRFSKHVRYFSILKRRKEKQETNNKTWVPGRRPKWGNPLRRVPPPFVLLLVIFKTTLLSCLIAWYFFFFLVRGLLVFCHMALFSCFYDGKENSSFFATCPPHPLFFLLCPRLCSFFVLCCPDFGQTQKNINNREYNTLGADLRGWEHESKNSIVIIIGKETIMTYLLHYDLCEVLKQLSLLF